MKEIELKNLRRKREKHFLQENGEIIAKIYSEDIHCFKNGQYEEIDNQIIENKNNYKNKCNSYDVYFSKDNTQSLFKMECDNHYLTMDLYSPTSISPKVSSNKVRYENIYSGIDLEYIVFSSKIKENIIIKSREFCKSSINFIIKTDLKIFADSNKISVKDKNNKIIFMMNSPYMFDSESNENHNIKLNIIARKDDYLVEFIFDSDFMNNAHYPIVIDPTITNIEKETSVYDTYIYSGDTDIDRNDEDVLKVGVEKINGKDVVNRTLIKFDLPTIGTGSQIISSTLQLVGYGVLVNKHVPEKINIHQITKDWSETKANWENMNDNYNSRIEDSIESGRSLLIYDETGSNLILHPLLIEADITNIVKKWYSDTPNYGILLKANNEIYKNTQIPAFYSKNNQIVGESPKPILIIRYRNQNGLENYMNYIKNPFTQGMTFFNTYNGNLTAIFRIIKTISKAPIEVNLIYNTNDVLLNKQYGFGLGYRLSYNQTVYEDNIDENKYYVYVDEDGTNHYFVKNGESFFDEDGLNLTLEVTDDSFIINDSGNRKVFTLFEKVGYLSKIECGDGKSIVVNYNDDMQIVSLVDGDKNEIDISYDINKICFSTKNYTSVLKYENNKLIKIEFKRGVNTLNYNELGLISSIVDFTGLKLTYEYYSQAPYRIKKIEKFGSAGSTGGYIIANYGYNFTSLLNEKNIMSIMTYNDLGNMIFSGILPNRGKLKDAYTLVKKYSHNTNSEDKLGISNNKLMSSSLIVKYVNNLLENTSFEEENIDFINHSEKILLSRTSEFSNSGNYSLKVQSSDKNQFCQIKMDVEKNNYYTFSAYVKSEKNFKMSIGYDEIESIETNLIHDNDFSRYDATIFLPENVHGNVYLKFYFDEEGDYYIDDIQLEEGAVANPYNMIENSDFSKGTHGWNLEAYDIETGDEIVTSDIFKIVDVSENGEKALKIEMNPSNRTNVSKSFNVKGKAGETYNISFWYKNEGLLAFDPMDPIRNNNVIIGYNYTQVDEDGTGRCTIVDVPPFNPNPTNWQYFSHYFVAEKDFSSIELIFYQNFNANDFYITNLYLYKDVRLNSFEYDEKDNIISTDSIYNDKTNFYYDNNNQLIKTVFGDKSSITYELDNLIKEKVLSETKSNGISAEVKYDEKENPKLLQVNGKICTNLKDGLYKIRLKGTQKYLKVINNSLQLSEDVQIHDAWNVSFSDNQINISHSILDLKYLTVDNKQIILSTFIGEKNLFMPIAQDNGSYTLVYKLKDSFQDKGDELSEDKFVPVMENENCLCLGYELTKEGNIEPINSENNFHCQFIFEKVDDDFFIERNITYDDEGKFIASITDSLLNNVFFDVNHETGKIKSFSNSAGLAFEYQYDDKDNVNSIKFENIEVQYIYDEYNRISAIKTANATFSFEYDEFSNVKSFKLNNKIIINYYYDEYGKYLLKKEYGNGNLIEYRYDDFGRVIETLRGSNKYEYKYDSNGELSKIISKDFTTKYVCNIFHYLSEYVNNDYKALLTENNENLIQEKHSWKNLLHTVIHDFDKNNFLLSTKFGDSIVNYDYDKLGRLVSKTINEDWIVSYEYLTMGKRTSTIVNKVFVENDCYEFTYDSRYNIIAIFKNGHLKNKFSYDLYGQLVGEWDYENNIRNMYEYDYEGNVIKKSHFHITTNIEDESERFGYDQNYKDLLIKYNDQKILYDEIGNPIKIGDDELSWKNGRELQNYKNSEVDVSYKYDQTGTRIQKVINGDVISFKNLGSRIIYESCHKYILYYTYNNLDGPIAINYNGQQYYYLKNNFNDIVAIIDSDNNIVARYVYDSWGRCAIYDFDGNSLVDDGTHIGSINPYRYRSYYYDRETDLYYIDGRYYNPLWGRFITPDNIVGANISVFGYNLYCYCGNNPISRTDISGNSFIDIDKIKNTFAKSLSQFFENFVNKELKEKYYFNGSIAKDKSLVCPFEPQKYVSDQPEKNYKIDTHSEYAYGTGYGFGASTELGIVKVGGAYNNLTISRTTDGKTRCYHYEQVELNFLLFGSERTRETLINCETGEALGEPELDQEYSFLFLRYSESKGVYVKLEMSASLGFIRNIWFDENIHF